jgi:O-phosphoseryl-tRNA(Cys) synthetase
MRFPAIWKYCAQQQFRNIVEAVMGVVTALLSHPIDDVKFVGLPNDGQHELSDINLSVELLRDIVPRYGSFRQMMKFKSKATLVADEKPSNCSFLLGIENWQQPLERFHQNA